MGFAALYPSYLGRAPHPREVGSSVHEADANDPIDGCLSLRQVHIKHGALHFLQRDERGLLRRVVADGFDGKRHPPILRTCIVDRAEDRASDRMSNSMNSS